MNSVQIPAVRVSRRGSAFLSPGEEMVMNELLVEASAKSRPKIKSQPSLTRTDEHETNETHDESGNEMKIAPATVTSLQRLRSRSSGNVLRNANANSSTGGKNTPMTGILPGLRPSNKIAPILKSSKSFHRGKSSQQQQQKRSGSILELSPEELQSYVTELVDYEDYNQVTSNVREKTPPAWYIIQPYENFRLRWDLVSMVLITYNAFVVPFEVAFARESGFSSAEYWSAEFDRSMDLFFILDILLNFVTAVETKNAHYYDLQHIGRHYLRTWFTIDCISAFPFSLVFGGQNAQIYRTNQLGKMLKLFRLIRLFRMFRMFRIMNRLEYALLIRSAISSVAKFGCIVVMTSHWFSCIFFAIASFGHDATTQDEHGLSSANDSANEPTFPIFLSWADQLHLFEDRYTSWDQYIASLYWSVMTMSTVGFGDVSAVTTEERLFGICAMIIGAGIFAYGITNIVAIVANLTADEASFRHRMDEVNEYMNARELPNDLRLEIREFMYNMRKSEHKKLDIETEVLSEISSMLRSKVALAINDHFLAKMPFFIGSDPNFLMELSLSMRMICFAALEDVVVEGEIGNEMFFIFRGAVEVLKHGEQIMILGENQYFGELAMLNPDCKRLATIRTLCFCELRLLSRVKFIEAMTHFPETKSRIGAYAAMRTEALQEVEQRQTNGTSEASSSSTGNLRSISDLAQLHVNAMAQVKESAMDIRSLSQNRAQESPSPLQLSSEDASAKITTSARTSSSTSLRTASIKDVHAEPKTKRFGWTGPESQSSSRRHIQSSSNNMKPGMKTGTIQDLIQKLESAQIKSTQSLRSIESRMDAIIERQKGLQ